MRVWLLTLLLLFGCAREENNTLRVAATPLPHADLLEVIKSDLKEQGVQLKIVEIDDYSLPNRLLVEGQVDANFFQHQPYLDEYNRQFGTHLIPLTQVHIEPLGIYSRKIFSLKEIPEGATVIIPSDQTNSARALKLLAESGLITLKPVKNETLLTIFDIMANPKKLKIKEVDAPFLPRALPDVDIAVIPVNFALEANLDPLNEALALEKSDSLYANIVVIREGEQHLELLKKLKKALHSERLRQHILQTYKGAIVPVS